MFNVVKILAAIMMARSAPIKLNLAKRLISEIAVIAGIVLMIAILAGTFVIGGVYYGYTLLIDGGYTQTTAIAITAGSVLAIIAGLVWLAVCKIRKLHKIPHLLAEAESPIGYKIHSIAEAFMQGLMKKSDDEPKSKQ